MDKKKMVRAAVTDWRDGRLPAEAAMHAISLVVLPQKKPTKRELQYGRMMGKG